MVYVSEVRSGKDAASCHFECCDSLRKSDVLDDVATGVCIEVTGRSVIGDVRAAAVSVCLSSCCALFAGLGHRVSLMPVAGDEAFPEDAGFSSAGSGHVDLGEADGLGIPYTYGDVADAPLV